MNHHTTAVLSRQNADAVLEVSDITDRALEMGLGLAKYPTEAIAVLLEVLIAQLQGSPVAPPLPRVVTLGQGEWVCGTFTWEDQPAICLGPAPHPGTSGAPNDQSVATYANYNHGIILAFANATAIGTFRGLLDQLPEHEKSNDPQRAGATAAPGKDLWRAVGGHADAHAAPDDNQGEQEGAAR